MNCEQKVLEATLNAHLSPLGFRRRGRNWVRESHDLYSVVNLQSSEWGAGDYVNVGFARLERVEGVWLPENKCEIRFRAESLNSLSREDIDAGGSEVTTSAHQAECAREGAAPSSGATRVGMALAELMTVVVAVSDLTTAIGDLLSDRIFIGREIRDELFAGRKDSGRRGDE